jgi:hypothetical protein
MSVTERWEWIQNLDEKLLRGDVTLPGWCSIIVSEADCAYIHGAHLATILTAVAGIETYLRSDELLKSKNNLARLIENAFVPVELKARLHAMRRYRNRWVHVDEPWDDEDLMDRSDVYDAELDRMAREAILLLRETIYSTQGV